MAFSARQNRRTCGLPALAVVMLACTPEFGDSAAGKDPKGAVNIDQLNFDKLIQNFDIMVRFDRQHAYGDKEREFKELCDRVGAAGGGGRSDFLLAYAGVTEFGDKFAFPIAERYGVTKKDTWPAYLYFTKGNATKPAARYHGTVQVDKLSAWLTDVADVYIGLAGTLKAFDAFARRFAETAADDAETRSTIFGEAEAALASVSTVDVDQIAKATVYIKIMKKVIANGSSYIADEIGRIQKLSSDPKLSDAKKLQFERKANVLLSFKPPSSAGRGGEL